MKVYFISIIIFQVQQMHLSNTYLVLIVDSSKEVQRHRSERRLSEERCRDYIDCKLLSLLQRIHKIILQQL